MRASGDFSLIFLISSNPLMSGSCRSTRVTSGRSWKKRSSASLPVGRISRQGHVGLQINDRG